MVYPYEGYRLLTAYPPHYTLQAEEAAVLMVDDNAADFELLRHGFSAAGIQCRLYQATTGKSAREWLMVNERPVFVVLDICLPDESGLAVLGLLTEDPKLKSIPSLVLSDAIRDTDYSYIQGCGSTCAVKPFELDQWSDLARCIKTMWLNRQTPTPFFAA